MDLSKGAVIIFVFIHSEWPSRYNLSTETR